MVCFHPIKAYYPLYTDEQGKRYLKFGKQRFLLGLQSSVYAWMFSEYTQKFKVHYSDIYEEPYNYPIYYDFEGNECGLNIKVPCGKCIGCRLDYSRMWATRSANEAYMHNHYNNCAFLTLTFNNDMLLRRSNPHSLNKVAFRNWLKRLRKAVKSEYDCKFRFMACGEYGAKHKRPHYHLIIYGFNFPDKYVYQFRRVHGKEVLYYRSPFLEKIWSPAYSNESYGFSVIGEVNFESSAYVARYVTKKLFGKLAYQVYKDIEPEFLLTSRMPGLGYSYLEKFYKNIFELGYIVLPNGHKAPIPRYYVNKLQNIDEFMYNKYRMSSFNNMCDNLIVENLDSTQERLICREELKKMNLDLLIRQYEFNEN